MFKEFLKLILKILVVFILIIIFKIVEVFLYSIILFFSFKGFFQKISNLEDKIVMFLFQVFFF